MKLQDTKLQILRITKFDLTLGLTFAVLAGLIPIFPV